MKSKPNFLSRLKSAAATLVCGVVTLGGGLLCGCDGYDLDELTPAGWGSSIYSYMADQGNYTKMVKIIDDLGYKDVLGQTGSKTLFAANDEAFDRFFQNNSWGVRRYEDLSEAQKRMLLFGAMVNNSYQVQMLSSIEGPVEGECMRRLSALGLYDTVSVIRADEMPDNRYWARHRDKGSIVCMRDMTVVPMIHFIEAQLTNKKITNDDYNFLFNHAVSRQPGDASVNGINIVEPNLRCSNGFIHRTEEVMTPLPNMAELIASKPQTTIFNHLLERFAAPYPCAEEVAVAYNDEHHTAVDTVYQKRFISSKSQNGNAIVETPDHGPVDAKLKYDPEWNSYFSSTAYEPAVSLMRDMAVMTVPSDEAMRKYWNEGAGRVLQDYYGTWDNVPDNVVAELINVNMLESFINSVPSKFQGILNDANDPMGVSEEKIDSVWMACNGAVYLTNEVFTPTAFVSVSYPALINETMKIVDWAIKKLKFNIYLNSLNSYYSFFLPTNNALMEYIDPVSYGKTQTQLFRFHYDPRKTNEDDRVWASIWNYDPVLQEVGDSIGRAGGDQVIDRLEDILNNHIVIGNVEDGHSFYRTKGNQEIRVNNVAQGAHGMTVEGSYQVNQGKPVPVSLIYDQSQNGNGKTYILEGEPIMGTQHTVFDVLESSDDFSEFRELLAHSGLVESIHRTGSAVNACGGNNIATFNNYHYTVYVPTNKSIRELIDAGKLPTWEQVEQWEEAGNTTKKTADSLKIVNFLRYHIQDNSVYIGEGNVNGDYETAVINPSTGRFYKLSVEADDSHLAVRDVMGHTRNVVKTAGLYNRMACEWQYNEGDAATARAIGTNSSAVVHLIDGPLTYNIK